MARKEIRRGGDPKPEIRRAVDPDSIMSLNPSWNFRSCDTDIESNWAFCKERLSVDFWDEVFPKLQSFEKMTWGEILIKAKKQNHSIDVDSLNKCARDRLCELRIEEEAVYSLRLTGKIRIYGFMVGSVFNILWYDNDHGNNDTCVCRSYKKHT